MAQAESQPQRIGIFSISGGTGTVGRVLIKIEFFLFRFPGAAKVRLERNISLAVVALHSNRGFCRRWRFPVAKSRTKNDLLYSNRGQNTGCLKTDCYRRYASPGGSVCAE